MVARAWEMESCWNAVRVSPHASTRLGWGRVSGCGDCAVSGAGRKAPKAISDRVRVWQRDISFTIPPLRREAMVSDLLYELRGGEPDTIDQMVGTAFGNIALDLIQDGVTGRMVAVQNGCYAHTALPASSLGPRKVDVPMLYNTNRYRPNYTSKLGAPLLFSRC